MLGNQIGQLRDVGTFIPLSISHKLINIATNLSVIIKISKTDKREGRPRPGLLVLPYSSLAITISSAAKPERSGSSTKAPLAAARGGSAPVRRIDTMR